METENKQLLTVINQLRNARKDKSNETESLTQELTQLRTQLSFLSQENSELKLFKDQYQQLLLLNQSTNQEHQILLKNYHSLQQEISFKDQQIVTLSNELLMKQQLLYEKEKILENKSYEEKFAKKSIENQLLEINNLKEIINNYENSFSSEMKEWKRKFYEMKEEKEKNAIAFEEKKKLEIHQFNQIINKKLKNIENLWKKKRLR